MAGLSPTQRTLKAMREQGRVCDVVERRIAIPGSFGITRDFLGFIDLIVLDPEEGVIGIQSTGSKFLEHRQKILEECTDNVREWLKAGGKLELWGWKKKKLKRGGKAMRWMPRVEDYWLDENDEIQYQERK